MHRIPQTQPDLTTPPLPLQRAQSASNHWRAGLPTLTGAHVTLRELRPGDAPALFAAMSTGDVAQFLSAPPTSIDGFERFIDWAHCQRAVGQYVCFAVTLRGSDDAIGLFQIRSLEPDFGNAEWGFALASEYWGRGLFLDGARLAIDFAFDVLGVRRLEARAVVKNHRGNGALRKLGAVQEGLLRRSFHRHGEQFDQVLWTIISDEWRDSQKGWFSGTIH
jgi:ribosomal-protein-alanine N-acetyltransferase